MISVTARRPFSLGGRHHVRISRLRGRGTFRGRHDSEGCSIRRCPYFTDHTDNSNAGQFSVKADLEIRRPPRATPLRDDFDGLFARAGGAEKAISADGALLVAPQDSVALFGPRHLHLQRKAFPRPDACSLSCRACRGVHGRRYERVKASLQSRRTRLWFCRRAPASRAPACGARPRGRDGRRGATTQSFAVTCGAAARFGRSDVGLGYGSPMAAPCSKAPRNSNSFWSLRGSHGDGRTFLV